MRTLLNRPWLGLVFYVLTGLVHADMVNSPGAIASIEAPPGLSFVYQAEMDLLQFAQKGKSQITVSVLPPGESKALLALLLQSLGAAQYASQIQDERVSGYPAATLRVQAQTSDRITVLSGRDLSLVFRVQDSENAARFDPWVEQAAKSLQLAPAHLPVEMVGSFQTSSQYSGADYGGVSGYSQSSVYLGAQGEVVYGGYSSFSGPGSSVLGGGGAPQGVWQVRGNRLIVFSPPGDFLNARFQVFRNGIEVYPAGGKTLLWVRQ